LNYGVSNKMGKVSTDEVGRILATAEQNGINTLDTAVSYGNSESVLGEIGVKNWNVISKVPEIPSDVSDPGSWILEQVEESLKRLRLSKIHGILLHTSKGLTEKKGDNVYRSFQDLKKNGLVDRIGISIYHTEELDELLPVMEFDIVQAPFNVLDKRLIESGWMQRLSEKGIELHARSVFLQGLLLMEPRQRHQYFSRWDKLLMAWDAWLKESSLTPIEASLGYVLSHVNQGVDKVIVGVDTNDHLQEIMQAVKKNIPQIPDYIECNDVQLLNPYNWKL